MKTLDTITNKFSRAARRKIGKFAMRATKLNLTAHSNEIMSEKITGYAEKLKKGQTKERLLEVASFVKEHEELCYEDFHEYFDDVKGWYPDEDLMRALFDCFRDEKIILKYMRQAIKNKYPSLKEEQSDNSISK